ncbi:MAG: hypothetical protein DRI44_05365 [Chlamydiae bacterium]|nr:MAG: hypothetical protein DRI44_05365 [Chlamydiota bacterium]
MKNHFSTSPDYVKWAFFIVFLFLFFATQVNADPIDETYYKTFYIMTLGGFNTNPNDLTNSLYSYRQRMLSQNGGAMPKNLKIGFSGGAWFLLHTENNYYNYIYDNTELGRQMINSQKSNLPIGFNVNGMPWGDTADQSVDILHNYLEKYNDGEFLQKDQNGNIRKSSLPQNPYTNEQAGTFSPYLEMQLSLSRNAQIIQNYVGRNNRMATGMLNWYREHHPDLLVFATMSSEYAQNAAANDEYCDYSNSAKQEFRDWLSGSGLYAGQGQYSSLTDFNNAFGFSYSSWDDVEPPTSIDWTSGSYWQKWNDFRIIMVNNMEQAQITWTVEAGWSPDRTYGHQIPFNPATTSEHERKYASPWTTTFVLNGANGITTYGSRTWDTTIFNAMYANDKIWGIFEYNPLSSSVSQNLSALNSVWNSKGHVVCPYAWYGQPTYQIFGTAFESALQQFISDHSADSYTGLKFYETAPDSRNIIWPMSDSDSIESSSGLSSIYYTNGYMAATINSADPTISLELDESSHYLVSDDYCAGSFRMYIENPPAGTGKIEWRDSGGSSYSINFTPKQGWNIYKIHLLDDPNWREKDIDEIKFYPGANIANKIKIDWINFTANHYWNFDSSDETYNPQNLSNLTFAAGSISGIDTSGDGYFYLATDKNNAADRAYIDAEKRKVIRFKMTSSANASAQFYWWTRTGGPFWDSIPIQSGTHSYELNLSNNFNWSGKIKIFRIDPVNVANANFSLEYLTVSPELTTPQITAPDTVVNSPLPAFTWTKPIEPSAPDITYSLQVATDFEFSNVVYSRSGLINCTNAYNENIIPDGLFWWRVRSESSNGKVSPWTAPLSMFIRVWDFSRAEDISSTHAMGTPSVTNGIWKAAVTNGDPYAFFHTGSSGINADLYKKFYTRVRMTPPSGGNETFQFYYFPTIGGFFATTKSVPRDGQWHIVKLDFSSDPNWTGYIRYFRIDPGHGANLTLEIDNAYFMPENTIDISILNTNLDQGIINVAYNQQLLSTGTVGITSWSLISGTLQSGLVFNIDGTITGTPTEPGTKILTFEIEDELARSTTKRLSLEIIPEPVLFIIYYLSFMIYYCTKRSVN